MYKMIHDLMLVHEAKQPLSRKKVTATDSVKNLDGQANKRPRTLRSGGTARKVNVRKQAEQAKTVATKARLTGKVTDVAHTLIKKG